MGPIYWLSDVEAHCAPIDRYFLVFRPLPWKAAPDTMEDVTRLDRITIDPELCHGKPVIRGLRYPVETLLELLASGMTIEDILADYADLEREDLLAALEFGARAAGIRRAAPLGAA